MQKRAIQVFIIPVLLLILTTITSYGAFAANTTTSGQLSSPVVTNPYAPAYQHPYRHGAVPTISQLSKIKSYQQAHPNAKAATSANTLSYGGGIDGIGVTSGIPKVYLVFWGTQWGTQSTSNGNLTFSNDAAGAAPRVQNLFKGLGTGNELWSGTMTQYCDGPAVLAGATSCPSGAHLVGYPKGGALAGVWYDNSGAEPNVATGNQLAKEAIKAAGHFGNTTALSNRYVQYVVMSGHGTNPDSYQGNYCAWHDYNGDTTLTGGAASSPYGDIAFTNMPYVLDAGSNCGQNFVNSGSVGTLDGFTIVEGHEYAETVTDQNPAGGWTSSSSGEENGDECAWITPGQVGGSGNVTTGNGTFPMQSTWSNDTNRCDLSHAIVGSGSTTNDFSLNANPTSLFIVKGSSSTSKISTVVTSGSAGTVSLSASVSPSGPTASLSSTSVIAGNALTLTVSVGSSVASGTYTVTVKGTEGSKTYSIPVSIIVASASGILNGSFETDSFASWSRAGTTSISTTAHSGHYSAQVGGILPTNGDSRVSQTFKAPSGTRTLSFWYQVNCQDTLPYDWATATLKDNGSKKVTTILVETCNLDAQWVKVSATITAGHSYTLSLISYDDNHPNDPTYTLYDDVLVS